MISTIFLILDYERMVAETIQKHQLARTHFIALIWLATTLENSKKEVNAKHMTDVLNIDNSAWTLISKTLREKGMLNSSISTTDRRRVSLSPTDDGMNIVRDFLVQLNSMF